MHEKIYNYMLYTWRIFFYRFDLIWIEQLISLQNLFNLSICELTNKLIVQALIKSPIGKPSADKPIRIFRKAVTFVTLLSHFDYFFTHNQFNSTLINLLLKNIATRI